MSILYELVRQCCPVHIFHSLVKPMLLRARNSEYHKPLINLIKNSTKQVCQSTVQPIYIANVYMCIYCCGTFTLNLY